MSDLVERVAIRLCCPSGACVGKGDSDNWSMCQAHTFRADARAAIAEVMDWLAEPHEATAGLANTDGDITLDQLVWQHMLSAMREEALGET